MNIKMMLAQESVNKYDDMRCLFYSNPVHHLHWLSAFMGSK